MKDTEVKKIVGATSYELINFIYRNLHDCGWKTTFNYLRRSPRKCAARKLQLPKGSDECFKKYVDYCYLLANNFTEEDEAARYRERQGTSIYFSVVLYWLLVYFGVLNEKGLKFCQGYFSYKVREEIAPDTKYRAGLHAWLCYHESVIDVTIWQQGDYFDFQKHGFNVPVIAGIIPEELNLVGFEEDKNLVKDYARQFAKDSGLTFCEWVDYHGRQADLLFNVRKLEEEITS